MPLYSNAKARDWSVIRFFKKEEWVKDPDKILWDTVLLMDEMRGAVGHAIKINVAWDDGGHASDSSHYATEGRYASAVDFYIEGMPLLDQWLFAERFPWNGIGVYPYWRHPGLHCDLRLLGSEHPHLGKRWWQNKNGVYEPFNQTMLGLLRSSSG